MTFDSQEPASNNDGVRIATVDQDLIEATLRVFCLYAEIIIRVARVYGDVEVVKCVKSAH